MHKSLSIIITLMLFSCSSEKPTATGPGPAQETDGLGVPAASQPASGFAAGSPYTVEIIPQEATKKSTLNLITKGFDLSRAKIEWLVNGRSFTTLAPAQFNGADATKGSTVQARAMVEEQEVLSNIVQIVNAPPDITNVKILPEVFRLGDTLSAEAAGTDADGDAVTVLFAWTKNGNPAGKGPAIEGQLKRGDKVSLTITPYDGEAHGRPVTIDREIRNLPPMFEDHRDFTFDGNAYEYQAKAVDPDGDRIIFSLESAPGGMSIDPSTGLLKWAVPDGFRGRKSVTITASDGSGGTSRYTVEIAISE